VPANAAIPTTSTRRVFRFGTANSTNSPDQTFGYFARVSEYRNPWHPALHKVYARPVGR
jgi:hypothetical protein